MALHFGERLGRIDHRETAASLHPLDAVEDLDEFVDAIVDQAGFAEAEVTRTQGRERVAERAGAKSEGAEELRKFVVVVDEAAGGDAGGGLDAEFAEDGVGALDLAADVREAPIFFRASARRGRRWT